MVSKTMQLLRYKALFLPLQDIAKRLQNTHRQTDRHQSVYVALNDKLMAYLQLSNYVQENATQQAHDVITTLIFGNDVT